MTARPIRRNAQTPDRNGKIFYTSTTSLSHISKLMGIILILLCMNGIEYLLRSGKKILEIAYRLPVGSADGKPV